MKAVLQRVLSAKLLVGDETVSEINKGLVVYLGVENGDGKTQCEYTARKIANMRIFEDCNGKMNKSVADVCGEILLVSQFTLCGDASHGNRPSFSSAMAPVEAKALYEIVADNLKNGGLSVKTGIFGADMQILQQNDGPVTIIL